MFRNTERSLRLGFAPRRARLLRRMRFFKFRAAIVGTVHRFPGTLGADHKFPSLCIAKKYLPYLADDLISTLLRHTKRLRGLMRSQWMAVVDFDRLLHRLIIAPSLLHKPEPVSDRQAKPDDLIFIQRTAVRYRSTKHI